MLYAILTLILVLAVYLPSAWVRFVMARHGSVIEDMPGTGSELATHLLARFELADVSVEETDNGKDHYDPKACAVRLGKDNFNGKSLTAVAVAAHEVGHALQFARKEPISALRDRYLPLAALLKKLGVMIMLLVPGVGLFLKAPGLIWGLVGLSVILQLAGAMAYLIVLPEEWDASFNKALPILVDGDYVPDHHMPAVRSVLQAAALTYFAAALADIVNIGRWLLILRR